jgi:glycosidase
MLQNNTIRFLLIGLMLTVFAGCKNYIGNPHTVALPDAKVPVISSDLRAEPGNWWTGLVHNTVEISFSRKDIADMAVTLAEKHPGVKIVKTEKGDSPNYLFVTLQIAPKAKAQNVQLVFRNPKTAFSFSHEFPILARNTKPKAQGVDSRDVVYLIFPDRFANGDPTNDNVPGMYQGLQRDSLTGRHGGDLQGIIDHLDYLQDLGVTALWLNPELENDQEIESYHGYALTDHYLVDRRLGTNELLKELVDKAHARGMKVVRDVVVNHVGIKHFWMNDLPTKDWINQWPVFTNTTYRAPTLVDPYAAADDKKRFSDGWFVPHMPDLNQRNPHLANYLIQQAIWWVEYAGFDCLRIDTYTYSEQQFMSRWCAELRKEYPQIGMFGEIWDHGVVMQGFFADNQPMSRAGFDSNLPGTIDFQLMFAINEGLNREQGWTEGINRVYYTLAQDYFYQDPLRNLIMLDNHDFSRFYSVVNEDYSKYESGLAFLLTTRGIPQLYYMTEILGTGNDYPSHGNIRKDFPGGWAGDKANKFTAAGRTEQENRAWNFDRTLIRYRNSHPVLQTGKLMQFVPDKSVYVYFRYNEKDNPVMVVINTANSERTFDTARFGEMMEGYSTGINVISGAKITNLTSLTVPKHSPLVLELRKE